MKKLLLLFSIAIGYLSAQSQVTFSASPTTVNSGQNVTLTSSFETNLAYLSSISSVKTNNANVTAAINGTINYGFGNTPTNFLVILTYPSGTGPVPVTLTVVCSLFDVNAGTEFPENIQVNQTVNVNPATLINTTFWNVAESGTFNRATCSVGSMGSGVNYTVAAHTYSSTVSQAAANQLAINDVNANGQNYANAHGSCTVVYARLQGTINSGEGSNVIAHFYSDAACTLPLALPGSGHLTVVWNKYMTNGTLYSVNSVFWVSQGATFFSCGHREFYSPPLPPAVIHVDWVASVLFQQSDNPLFTTEPASGVFTNN